jgi:PAS domain S-box-containing protein
MADLRSIPAMQRLLAGLARLSPWWLVAAALVLVGTAIAFDLRRQYHAAAAIEQARLDDTAHLLARGVELRLTHALALLERLDAALAANPDDAEAIVRVLEGMEPGVALVAVADASGSLVASSRPQWRGRVLAGDAVVAAALNGGPGAAYLGMASLAAEGERLLVRQRRGDRLPGVSLLLLGPAFFEQAMATAAPRRAALVDPVGRIQGTAPPGDGFRSVRNVGLPPNLDGQPGLVVEAWRDGGDWSAEWRRKVGFGLLLWLGVALIAILAGAVASQRRRELGRLAGLHRRLLQGADEGIVGVDGDARVRFANPAFAAACGLTPGDLLGRPLADFVRFETEEDPLEALLSGQQSRYEGIARVGAEQRLQRVTVGATREQDQISGALLSFADPGTVESASMPRGPAERLYRTLFDLSPDGVIIVDLDSERPLAFNHAAQRLLGYDAERFAQMRIREHEAGSAPMDTIRHIARAVAVGHEEFETRYKVSGGSAIDVQVVIHTIEFAGRPALYWLVRDITERKRAVGELRASEALMRALIERLPLPLAVFDGERLALSNARYQAELDARMHAGLDLPAWAEIACADEAARQRLESAWASLASEGPAHAQIELELPYVDGLRRAFELHLARVDSRTLVVLVDLSQHRLAEQRLTEARELAERTQRARSEFLANMSHEIRTPMTTILGLAYLLRKSALDALQTERVERIESAARALLIILDDLLDYAKLETGRIQIEERAFDLRAVLSDIRAVFDGLARDKGLEFTCEAAPAVPNSLLGDPVRIRQVLFNLVGNAIKFTERGRVLVRAEAEALGAGEVELTLVVRDTGIGIEPQKLERVFEPFAQGDAASTRRFGGTGLGLPISRGLVDLMGGHIEVDTEAGRGSEFRVRLALGRSDAEQREPERGDRRLAIVVDDDPTAARALSHLLEVRGWQVRVLGDGESLLELLYAQPGRLRTVDLLVVDLILPGIGGVELLRRAFQGQGPRQTPVILVSAQGALALAESADLRDLVDVSLGKPIEPEAFSAAIDRACARHGRLLPETSRRLAGVRVLLVEDHPINRQVAREILVGEGAQVTVAGDGLEAVEVLRADPGAIDVVLMDVQMPRMDGYGATREIRGGLGLTSLPVIAMTANASAEDRADAFAAGMNDHLAKPVDVHALVAAVRRQLHDNTGDAARPATVMAEEHKPVLALERALARLAGNLPLFRQMARLFVQEQRDSFAPVRKSLAAGERSDAERAAHTLKGVAATMGAERLADAAGRVERAIRKHQSEEELERLLSIAEVELESAIAALAAAAGPEEFVDDCGVPEDEFDAEAFDSVITEVIAALREQDMAAVDLFAELRTLATDALLRRLASAESALSRLDFATALAELSTLHQGSGAAAMNGAASP